MWQRRPQKEPARLRLKSGIRRHMTFARRIAVRYAVRVPGWQRSLVMTLARRSSFQSIVHRHWRRAVVRISPRINLNLATVPRETSSPPRSEVSAPVSPIRRLMTLIQSGKVVERVISSIQRESLLQRVTSSIERESLLRRVTPSIESESLLQRMVTRRRRIQADERFDPDGAIRRPISRVVRREPGVPRERRSYPARPAFEATASPRIHGRASEFATTQTEAPAIDVNRLSDEVIRSIDRRIIAKRERLGRM